MNLLDFIREEDIDELEIYNKRVGLKVLEGAIDEIDIPENVKRQLQAIIGTQLHKDKVGSLLEKIVEARRAINTSYKDNGVREVFESNEKIIYLLKPCNTESDFNSFILTISGIIDADLQKFTSYVIVPPSLRGSINIYELYLNTIHGSGTYNPVIIQNLKDISVLRSKKFPTHFDTPVWKQKVEALGFQFPVNDWQGLSCKCLEIYFESLINILATF